MTNDNNEIENMRAKKNNEESDSSIETQPSPNNPKSTDETHKSNLRKKEKMSDINFA